LEIDMAPAERAVERKGRVELMIETLATGFGNGIGWMASHGVLFLVFAAIWVAFGVALVASQGSLDQVWESIRELPVVLQVVLWVLLLPVMFGLWAWETSWPLVVRLVLVLGVAGWNLLVFLPRAAASAQS
jgi:hypothetical protein